MAKKLNDIVRDLGLAKDAAEYLASNLKNDGLLAKGVHVLQFSGIGRKTFFLFSRKKNVSSIAQISKVF